MTSEAAGCVHDALLFGSDDELVAATTPFVVDGIAAGDIVIVHGGAHDVAVLREALRDDPRVHFGTGTDLYPSAIGAIANYQRMCERENPAGRRVRSTGPVPFGDNPVRIQWMQYEALVSRALGPYRFSGLCRYDTRTTPPDLIDLARQTHTRLVTADGATRHDGERTKAQLLRDLAPTGEPDPLEAAPPVLVIGNASAPAPVRHDMLCALLKAGTPPDQADGLVAAVSEVVTNALQHGRPQVGVRLHGDRHRWLCVVTDHGPGIPDPYTGFDSPLAGNPDRNGMGLWLARQLCDELTITTSPTGGATVRLSINY